MHNTTHTHTHTEKKHQQDFVSKLNGSKFNSMAFLNNREKKKELQLKVQTLITDKFHFEKLFQLYLFNYPKKHFIIEFSLQKKNQQQGIWDSAFMLYICSHFYKNILQ